MIPFSNENTLQQRRGNGNTRPASERLPKPPVSELGIGYQESPQNNTERERFETKYSDNNSTTNEMVNANVLDHQAFTLEPQGNSDDHAPKTYMSNALNPRYESYHRRKSPHASRSLTSVFDSPTLPHLIRPNHGEESQLAEAAAPESRSMMRDQLEREAASSIDISLYPTQMDVITRIDQVEDEITKYEEMQQELEKLRSIEEAARKVCTYSSPQDANEQQVQENTQRKIRRAKQLNRLLNFDAEKELCHRILQANRRMAKERTYLYCNENSDEWDNEELWSKPLYPRIGLYPCFKANELTFEKLKPKIALALYKERRQVAFKENMLKTTYRRLLDDWKAKNKVLDNLRDRERKGKKHSSWPSQSQDDIVFNDEVDSLRSEPAIPGAPMARPHRGPWTSDAARSEAELLEIIQSLESADNRNPELRAAKTTAAIPGMIIDRKQRARTYDDRSGLVLDPLTYYHTGADTEDAWTSREITSFMKGYVQYPKQFGKVASVVGSKSASQCVLFYYRKKNAVNFKGLLSKGRQSKYGKRRDRPVVRSKGSQKTKGSALMADMGQARGSRKEYAFDREPSPSEEGDDVYLANEKLQKTAKSQARRKTGQAREAVQIGSTTGRWSERERRVAVEAFKKFGRDFISVAATVETKSEDQCRNFYFNHKRKYGPDVFGEESRQKMTVEEEDAVTALMNMMGRGDRKTERPSQAAFGFESPEERVFAQPRQRTSKSDNKTSDWTGSRRSRTTPYSSYWTMPEKESFQRYLTTIGPDWEKISEALQTKTATQVRNFYVNNQEKLGLKEAMPKHKMTRGETLPPMGIMFESPNVNFSKLEERDLSSNM